MTKPKNMLAPHVDPALGVSWVKTDGGHHVDSPKMAKVLKGRGGPRPGSGPKVGPDGPADARLNIKCTKAEKLRWKDAAELRGRGLSEFVRTALNIASRSP